MMVLNLTNKFNENENHFPRVFCEKFIKIVAFTRIYDLK